MTDTTRVVSILDYCHIVISRAGTKIDTLVEAANAAATPSTPPLKVRRPLPDVEFPKYLPYAGVVKGITMPDPSALPDAFKDKYHPVSSPNVLDPK